MKLRNKRTGEILGSLGSFIIQNPNRIDCETITKYDSLAELNEEWEDYEEPKDHWYINYQGEVYVLDPKAVPEYSKNAKEIGNYFETKEEAEKAAKKLKAWKRLKDNGFKFKGIMENWVGRGESPLNYMRTDRTIHFNKQGDNDWLDENWKDLILLFGREE